MGVHKKMNFEDRAKHVFSGLSPMVKGFLPAALIALLMDICKRLDAIDRNSNGI
jgi:hypothetical protein